MCRFQNTFDAYNAYYAYGYKCVSIWASKKGLYLKIIQRRLCFWDVRELSWDHEVCFVVRCATWRREIGAKTTTCSIFDALLKLCT